MTIEPTPNSSQIANPPGAVQGDLVASSYMLISVLALSITPLAVSLANAFQAPLLFNACLQAGASTMSALFILAFYRHLIFSSNNLLIIREHVVKWQHNWLLALTIIGFGGYAFFAWSIRFIDVAVASIIFETWPIVSIYFIAWLFKDEGRYQKITITTYLLILVSIGGFILAIASQNDDLGTWSRILDGKFLIGLALLVPAVFLYGIVVCGFKWGADLSQDLAQGDDSRSLELFGALTALFLASFIAVFTQTAAGLSLGESLNWSTFGIGLITGIFVGVGGIAWRKANFTTSNPGINAMAYGTPVLSVLWLFAFSQTDVARPDYLIMGAAAIITSNLLINFEAEIRWGFKALLLALGTCGAIVYLRDGIFELLGIAVWHWAHDGYFESITLAATVFILLLAFRVTRLVGRTSEEDNRTFLVYRKLDMLARRGVVNPEVCKYILDIDRARNNSVDEKEAYEQARRLIAEVDPRPLNEADSQLLSDAETNLDALARSKQRDIHLGEMFALFIFGGITIGLALFSLPPQVDGWTRLLTDLIAMLASSVIVFLLVHIQDLQRERDERKLALAEPRREYRHYAVRFLDTQQRFFDQWLSIVIGAAIVLTYAALLAHKWLGWFG